ncbi:MAG: hypothetical protein FRX49_00920 [Trebouxia sp. A1-2]|nr:MAG: hypothetical protein FRX49_00920 [Trebouxia sp. A1-2]
MACSSSDRSYPSEPRVGVGVVILRQNAHNKASAEVLLLERQKRPRQGSLVVSGWISRISTQCSVAQGGLAFSKNLQVPTPFAAADVISRDAAQKIEYHYTIVAAVLENSSIVAKAASDVDDIKWVPVSSLRQNQDLVVNAATIAEEAAERFDLSC